MRIKVVAETTGANPSVTVVIACPKCGDEQTLYGDTVISITAEKPGII
jgi:ribosomal protein S27E